MGSKQVTPRLYAGWKIHKLVQTNPAREGTKRHAIIDVLFKARTCDKAYATPVKVGRRTVYPNSSNIRRAVHVGLIELVQA